MKFPIYFDYASTTPVDPMVLQKMTCYMTINNGMFGNASSRSHYYGWKAAEAIDNARQKIATLISTKLCNIIFTSGATESNNLAIKGVAFANISKGNHIITSEIEHKSILDTCRYLETKGFIITKLKPQNNGIISSQEFKNSIRDTTILVSLMHVNNETGVIQDIENFGKICKEAGIIFHVDATQSIGKLSINLQKLSVDLMSFNAHKVYGPKGIGGLFIRREVPYLKVIPQIHGGKQEFGIRAGTLPVHQIVGMGEAYHILLNSFHTESLRLKKLRDMLWEGLKKIEGISNNTDLNNVLCNFLNISFTGIKERKLLTEFKNLAISSGSACMSGEEESSYVLKSMGISDDLAYNSIRFSLGKYTTLEDIKYAILYISQVIESIRV